MITKRLPSLSALAVTALLSFNKNADACTSMLITPGASEDGSAMISYNADDETFMGALYHYPSSVSRDGKMRKIYDWDSGEYSGKIPEANVTYNVVGHTNEHGLIICETTFEGVEILAGKQTDVIMDYGSLIFLTLQRCKTALEAIHTMAELMDTYGYSSEGESYSIADRTGQVWIMEVIGRGDDYGKKGATWVAQRIPDGMVSAHANQARIRTFPRDDPENCLYADDVVDVAVHYGLYPASAEPLDFSFSDVYHPVRLMLDARQGDSRVWSIFSKVADDNGKFANEYLEYALGHDFVNRMPLYVKPYKKLAVKDVITLMGDHFENTPLDQTKDVGSGIWASPYRPDPIEWTFGDNDYFNERTIGYPHTGMSFIAQTRPFMPPELASIFWVSCDDASTSPRVPIYGSSIRVPGAYYGKGTQDGAMSPVLKFDLAKAFWVQNMVSNLAYSRWKDIYPVLQEKLDSIHEGFVTEIGKVDQHALQAYYDQGAEAAVDYVTNYSVNAGDKLHKKWMDFYGELFVKFRDFVTFIPNPDDLSCGCESVEPGFTDAMKKRIVEETGERYLVTDYDPKEGKEMPAGSFLLLKLMRISMVLLWLHGLVASIKYKLIVFH